MRILVRFIQKNAKILFEKLQKLHTGDFEEMLIKEFGITFKTQEFERFCNEHGIEFNHNTWS